MGRERKEFKRISGVRDASLVVVATEGEKCEPVYFETLKRSDQFHNLKIHLELLPSEDGRTSPKYVLDKLNNFKKEYKLKEDDELWLVVDRDFKSWTQAELSLCNKECRQKGIKFCISNPCFELWILLHFMDVDSKNKSYKEKLLRNEKTSKRTFNELKIIEKRGRYNKSSPDYTDLIDKTELAMSRAAKLTKNNTVNLFDELGSDINLLVARIIAHPS